MSAKSIDVTIFGRSYSVILTKDEEYIRKLAKIVDEKIKEIDNAAPNASLSGKAVLACLNLADDLLSCISKNEKDNLEIKDSINSLVKEVDIRLSKMR